jgi:hypothetical protein
MTTRRTFTAHERRTLRSRRPPMFAFPSWWAVTRELREGLADVIELKVKSAWKYGGCDREPGCCPQVLLLLGKDEDFVTCVFWLDRVPERIGEMVTVVRSPATRHLLAIESVGPSLIVSSLPRHPSVELEHDVEVGAVSTLPEEVRAAVSAA